MKSAVVLGLLFLTIQVQAETQVILSVNDLDSKTTVFSADCKLSVIVPKEYCSRTSVDGENYCEVPIIYTNEAVLNCEKYKFQILLIAPQNSVVVYGDNSKHMARLRVSFKGLDLAKVPKTETCAAVTTRTSIYKRVDQNDYAFVPVNNPQFCLKPAQ